MKTRTKIGNNTYDTYSSFLFPGNIFFMRKTLLMELSGVLQITNSKMKRPVNAAGAKVRKLNILPNLLTAKYGTASFLRFGCRCAAVWAKEYNGRKRFQG